MKRSAHAASPGRVPIALVIVLACVAVIATLGGGGWWWWQQNAEKMKEAAMAAYAEGTTEGGKLDQSGCLAGALARHGDKDNQSIVGSVRTSLYLRGCLDNAKADPKFCTGVPAKGEILAIGTWAGTRCAEHGYSDAYCGHILGQIPEYCSSK